MYMGVCATMLFCYYADHVPTLTGFAVFCMWYVGPAPYQVWTDGCHSLLPTKCEELWAINNFVRDTVRNAFTSEY